MSKHSTLISSADTPCKAHFRYKAQSTHHPWKVLEASMGKDQQGNRQKAAEFRPPLKGCIPEPQGAKSGAEKTVLPGGDLPEPKGTNAQVWAHLQ